MIQVSNQQPLYATPSYNGHLPAITAQEHGGTVESRSTRFTRRRVQELDDREEGDNRVTRGRCCCWEADEEVDGSVDTRRKWYRAVEGVKERQQVNSASADENIGCSCSGHETGKIQEVKCVEDHVYEELKTVKKCECEIRIGQLVRSRRNNSDPPTFSTTNDGEFNAGLAARYRDSKYKSEPSLM